MLETINALLPTIAQLLLALGAGAVGKDVWGNYQKRRHAASLAGQSEVVDTAREHAAGFYIGIIEALQADNQRLWGENARVEALLSVERRESDAREKAWAEERRTMRQQIDRMEREFMAEVRILRQRLAEAESSKDED